MRARNSAAARLSAVLLLAGLSCSCFWRWERLFVGAPLRRAGSSTGILCRARGGDEAPPSWSELEGRLPSSRASEPLVHDSALDSTRPRLSGLALFRERNGWCPYSERVWLAVEMKGLQYQTVLIDNMGRRPSWYGGQTPQVRWEDGKTQGESLDIIRELDTRYPDTPQLWRGSEVTDLVNAFKRIFPSGTRPSSRAAFLFKGYGDMPVWRSEFEATLDGADELLARHGGPFFHGAQPSAADCAWAPFLERYAAQLPCLHAGLNPRDADRWPRLAAWYTAMEEQVPSYSARVQGDSVSWRRVLAQAGFGNGGVAPVLVPEDESSAATAVQSDSEGDWATFAKGRKHVAATPAEEAAARIVRNRLPLVADASRKGDLEESQADVGLRGVAAILAGASPEEDASPEVVAAADYLDERMCVPRDMGVLPARAIRALAERLRERSG